MSRDNAPLFLVTLQNPDGTTKTVLKSQQFDDAISCYEMTPQQISALYLAGHADLPGDRGTIPAILRRRIALFAAHPMCDPASKKLVALDLDQRAEVRRIAFAIGSCSPFEIPTLTSPHAIVDHVLDAALNGDEDIVHRLLRTNARYLLSRGSATDFSGRQYDGITPYQAAIVTGDVEMIKMMEPFFDHLPDGQTQMLDQMKEIYRDNIHGCQYIRKQREKLAYYQKLHFEGQQVARVIARHEQCIAGLQSNDPTLILNAHDQAQQDDTFDFESIIARINQATPAELDAAIKKEGAQFTESDAARVKSDDQLTLVEALNRFREQFAKLSQNETIFNPYHLLRTYEAYNKFWDQCGRDGSDRDYEKRNLFWRQIIGYVQRFVPACYAQAFVQGLWDLVKVGGCQNSDWHPNALERSLKFKDGPGSYFLSSPSSSICSGLGFDFAGGWSMQVGLVCARAVSSGMYFQKLLSIKNSRLEDTYAASSQLHVSC